MKQAGMKFSFSDLGVLKDIDDFGALCEKIATIYHLFRYSKNINIVKIYDFHCFEECLSIKVPRWVIGTGYDNTVLVLDKSKWMEPNSMSMDTLILHEMVHIILANYCKGNLPIWLNEGLAVFLSEQKIEYDETQVLKMVRKYNIYDMDYGYFMLYECSSLMVKAMIWKYGMDKIFSDIKYIDENSPGSLWSRENICDVVEEYCASTTNIK